MQKAEGNSYCYRILGFECWAGLPENPNTKQKKKEVVPKPSYTANC